MKVAVVGAGIAGLGAARALVSAGHEVVLYDAAARPGGHVHTVDIDGRAASAGPRSGAQRGEVSIDMGFIVCNRERYPLFFAMLAELGVKTRPTTMTFSVALPERELEWSTASLFAQRRRVLDRAHWRFLVDVLTFLRRARRDLELGRVTGTLDDYVQGELRDAFAVPLAASLWSLAPDRCGDFPAETFVRFLDQHGMLRAVRPLAWHTIEGGSQRYVEALVAALRRGRFELRLGTPVERITRLTGITVVAGERQDRYDRVIIATHANTALSLLDDATPDERRVLGAFGYSTNRTVLHTDRSFLPRAPSAHAAWNYVADPQSAKVAVTYSMTRLQGLPDAPYLVTLNPRTEPRGILHEVMFAHPQLDAGALAAQSELPRLANTRRTYYAGAYFGFGFHEDGLRAGLAAAARCMADGARE